MGGCSSYSAGDAIVAGAPSEERGHKSDAPIVFASSIVVAHKPPPSDFPDNLDTFLEDTSTEYGESEGVSSESLTPKSANESDSQMIADRTAVLERLCLRLEPLCSSKGSIQSPCEALGETAFQYGAFPEESKIEKTQSSVKLSPMMRSPPLSPSPVAHHVQTSPSARHVQRRVRFSSSPPDVLPIPYEGNGLCNFCSNGDDPDADQMLQFWSSLEQA
ncbi:unnamed protein product [Polarella glacialis]|uniref:Uncharacterized protein n=1 Tax=Polarella glacialis TaxID=89957 RepID=A0A813H5N3_POLGL|nr:unnamed protein product [Polarella glacialis]